MFHLSNLRMEICVPPFASSAIAAFLKDFESRTFHRNSAASHCQVVRVNILSGRRLSKLSIGSSSFAVSTLALDIQSRRRFLFLFQGK